MTKGEKYCRFGPPSYSASGGLLDVATNTNPLSQQASKSWRATIASATSVICVGRTPSRKLFPFTRETRRLSDGHFDGVAVA